MGCASSSAISQASEDVHGPARVPCKRQSVNAMQRWPSDGSEASTPSDPSSDLNRSSDTWSATEGILDIDIPCPFLGSQTQPEAAAPKAAAPGRLGTCVPVAERAHMRRACRSTRVPCKQRNVDAFTLRPDWSQPRPTTFAEACGGRTPRTFANATANEFEAGVNDGSIGVYGLPVGMIGM